MDNKIGAVNWSDVKTNSGNDFINLVQGSNKFRILTQPYQFIVHWTKDPSGANKKLRCSTKGCPVCQHMDVKAQPRWYVGVIARKEEKCGIIEISSQIMQGIKLLATDPDWGDPSAYDVDITRGAKGQQPLYNVNPKPAKKLTKAEQGMVDSFLESLDLEKMITPPTPEVLTEKLLELGFTDLGSSSGEDEGDEEPFNFED